MAGFLAGGGGTILRRVGGELARAVGYSAVGDVLFGNGNGLPSRPGAGYSYVNGNGNGGNGRVMDWTWPYTGNGNGNGRTVMRAGNGNGAAQSRQGFKFSRSNGVDRFAVEPSTGSMDLVTAGNIFQDTGQRAPPPYYRFSYVENKYVRISARRVNVLNPQALARAHRRVAGFDAFVKKNFSLVEKSCKFKPKKKRRSCS